MENFAHVQWRHFLRLRGHWSHKDVRWPRPQPRDQKRSVISYFSGDVRVDVDFDYISSSLVVNICCLFAAKTSFDLFLAAISVKTNVHYNFINQLAYLPPPFTLKKVLTIEFLKLFIRVPRNIAVSSPTMWHQSYTNFTSCKERNKNQVYEKKKRHIYYVFEDFHNDTFRHAVIIRTNIEHKVQRKENNRV